MPEINAKDVQTPRAALRTQTQGVSPVPTSPTKLKSPAPQTDAAINTPTNRDKRTKLDSSSTETLSGPSKKKHKSATVEDVTDDSDDSSDPMSIDRPTPAFRSPRPDHYGLPSEPTSSSPAPFPTMDEDAGSSSDDDDSSHEEVPSTSRNSRKRRGSSDFTKK